ncbi:SAV_6107 family HEPN domain-containing protein [Nocardioides bruguierae]|uniref:SAV_6107 family HEPN domain-containing protein n=1 Tax=Nocardioides bruguierae TaxID=2945102 RepID=UPI00202025DD|nr:SAV_6107 family HEPN domain-containing protein [Nocardioides bruguierae]MCL8027006.1 SAV_6107 family HEPN domain-containing protein [Nocardioides bruguierae]
MSTTRRPARTTRARARSGESPWVEAPPPHLLPATTHSYLLRSADSIAEAVTATDVALRYASAHVGALRAAAALLAARARPDAGARRRPQKSAWVLLAEVAPELGEWAQFFAAGAAKRAAAEAGSRRAVTEREADDLVRDADRFLAVVEQSLGLVPHRPVVVRLAQAGGTAGGSVGGMAG